MNQMWAIEGKTFLITGGATGLGALFAEAFLKEGAKNVAIVDIAVDAGKATTARLNSTYPGKVIFVKCDVSVEAEAAAAFEKVVAEFGQLDVLINNAGIMNDAPEVWRKACDVNWQGLISFTMKAQQHMRKDEGGAGGAIINLSSIAGFATFKALPAYSGCKAAVLHFSQSIAEEPFYEQTGVRILTICPGPTDTPLMQGLKKKAYREEAGERLEKEYAEITAVRPSQKPESVVAAVVQMFKEGANRSVWLAHADRPAQDITGIVRNSYEQFGALLA